MNHVAGRIAVRYRPVAIATGSVTPGAHAHDKQSGDGRRTRERRAVRATASTECRCVKASTDLFELFRGNVGFFLSLIGHVYGFVPREKRMLVSRAVSLSTRRIRSFWSNTRSVHVELCSLYRPWVRLASGAWSTCGNISGRAHIQQRQSCGRGGSATSAFLRVCESVCPCDSLVLHTVMLASALSTTIPLHT